MAINKIPNTYVNNNAAWVPLRTVAIKVNEVIDGLNEITDGTETFENITVTDTATVDTLVVETSATVEELTVTTSVTSATVVTESVQTEDGLTTIFLPYGVNSPQEITGSGALQVSTYQSIVNTTGGGAYTLGDGTVIGHIKKVTMIVDGGDATITPTNCVFTNVTLSAVGDGVVFLWNGTDWLVLELIGGAAITE
jgi:hypothetical protein